jgi:nitrogen-specific signal transduction histidine kinase
MGNYSLLIIKLSTVTVTQKGSARGRGTPGTDRKEPADIRQAIRNTAMVCKNEWKCVAEMVLELDGSLPTAPCYIGQLNQVFLNIIVNATHVVGEKRRVTGEKEKGRIGIRTALAEESPLKNSLQPKSTTLLRSVETVSRI